VSRRAALLLSAACAALAARASAQRPDSPNSSEPPPRFSANDRVESFDAAGGAFRIHYTRAGEHAVPSADVDGDGVPDYVQQVAAEYAAVGEFYAGELGFERPLSDADVRGDNGGDDRFDVYLLDFATSSDGEFRREGCLAGEPFRCTGYMLHENDFNGRNYPSLARATRILASHEYFHAVQSAYDADAGRVIGEGTAVWASEQYDPTLTDLQGFVAGYLDNTERSLAQEPAGPFDQFSYGSSLFFQYLGERYGRDVIGELWQALRAQAAAEEAKAWPDVLDRLLRDAHDSSLAEAFTEFSSWNLFTGGRADAQRGYARGEGYPELEAKGVSLPYEDTALRVFPLAARFFSARVMGRGELRFVLGGAADLQGVRLLLARVTSTKLQELQLTAADGEAALTLSDVSRGDTVFAAVINTRRSGESARPDVCLGECATDVATPSGDSAGCAVSRTADVERAPWLLAALCLFARRRARGLLTHDRDTGAR
jgi:hypothetical protein